MALDGEARLIRGLRSHWPADRRGLLAFPLCMRREDQLTHVLRCYNWVARYIYKRKKGGVSYVYSRKPFQGIHVNPVRVYAKEMSLADRYNDQNRLLMSTTIARRPKFRIGREFRENKRRFLGFTSWDNIR